VVLDGEGPVPGGHSAEGVLTHDVVRGHHKSPKEPNDGDSREHKL
jgi:hypothetical protein